MVAGPRPHVSPRVLRHKYDCLYEVADFNGDDFDDLAVRCLAVSVKGKILDDTTTIYAIQHGQPQVLIVKDPKQLATIPDQFCVNGKKSKFCPSK